MRRSVPWLAATLCLSWIAIYPASADEPIVWVTAGDYPPFATGSDDGVPAGLDRDIAEAICRELARSCSFVATSWDGLLVGLDEGRYDVAFSGLTRATVVSAGFHASRSYFVSGARFVVLEGLTGPRDVLDGDSVVGVLAGTPHEAYLAAHLSDVARLRRFPDEEELYLSLLGGGVEVVFADGLPLYRALMLHPASLPVVFAGPEIDDPNYFDAEFVFAFALGAPLIAAVDDAIAALAADGTLERIAEHRLPGYGTGLGP
jgi:ABC-type amino acid transport substrate-binding protein